MSAVGGTTLRPMVEGDLPFVARASMPWARPGETEADVLRGLQDRFRAAAPFATVEFAIEVDGRLVGNVQARRDPHLVGLFDVGIVLFGDEDKGHGVGRVALRLIVTELFEREGAHRVQLSTDVVNAAMRRAAEAAGFAFEGVQRGYWPPAPDRPAADYALYAITRDDYEDVN